MNQGLAALPAQINTGLSGVLLANMVESWLEDDPHWLATTEAADELQDHRTTPEQTRLHLCTPVDERPSAPPSGEHGTTVCAARDGAGAGLERIHDPHARPGPGNDRYRDDQARGLQDLSGGCLDESSGRSVCPGSLPASALEPRLASPAGVVCAHRHSGDRRRWLLRSIGFQRRIVARIEGDHGPGRATFFARAPPGR